MREDDNPTVGILLVTDKNNALVEYATAGMDNQLFVSKYLLELPQKKQIEAIILKELISFATSSLQGIHECRVHECRM